MVLGILSELVADHPAGAHCVADLMSSSASARCSRRYNDRSGCDDDRRPSHICAAPTIGPAMEAGTTAASDRNDQTALSLMTLKRHGP